MYHPPTDIAPQFLQERIPSKMLSNSIILLILFTLRVNHSKNAIVKPPSKSSDKDRKDIDKAMRRVKEASSIIEDEIDPGTFFVYIIIQDSGQ